MDELLFIAKVYLLGGLAFMFVRVFLECIVEGSVVELPTNKAIRVYLTWPIEVAWFLGVICAWPFAYIKDWMGF